MSVFYVARSSGKVIGKFTDGEFKAKIRMGDFSPGDQYLAEGMKQWVPCSSPATAKSKKERTFIGRDRRTVRSRSRFYSARSSSLVRFYIIAFFDNGVCLSNPFDCAWEDRRWPLLAGRDDHRALPVLRRGH
jgi:hypothetical protein